MADKPVGDDDIERMLDKLIDRVGKETTTRIIALWHQRQWAEWDKNREEWRKQKEKAPEGALL